MSWDYYDDDDYTYRPAPIPAKMPISPFRDEKKEKAKKPLKKKTKKSSDKKMTKTIVNVEESPKPKPKTKATLIKLEDQREILCGPDVANLMIEFAKTFNAQIYTIAFNEPQEIELMDLDEAIALICDGKSSDNIPAHSIVTILINAEDRYPKELKNAVASILAKNGSLDVAYLVKFLPTIGKSVIMSYLGELSNKIKSEGILKVEFDENYLKVS